VATNKAKPYEEQFNNTSSGGIHNEIKMKLNEVENKHKESLISVNELRTQIKIKDRLIMDLKVGTGEHFNLGRELISKDNLIKTIQNKMAQMNYELQEQEGRLNTVYLEKDLLESELDQYKKKRGIMQRRLKNILTDMWSERIFKEDEINKKL